MLRRLLPVLLLSVPASFFYTSTAKADPFKSDPSTDESTATATAPTTTTTVKPAPASMNASKGPRDSWYGYQTLSIDLPAASLTAIGAFSQHAAGGALAVFGLSAYALGGPIVHWAHGHVGRGFGSLAMRLGIPLTTGVTGMIIGLAAQPDQGRDALFGWVDQYVYGMYGLIIGGVVGTAGASVIDSLALAREHSSPSDKPTTDEGGRFTHRPTASSGVRWQPTIAPARGGGFQAGVGGIF